MDTSGGFVCDRCYKPARMHSVSYFNTEDCCIDCLTKEKQHPDYERARSAELDAVRQGNMNYPGIGKPADL